MSRISKAFANKKAFIGYLTAGDAGKKEFLELVNLGVNILEVGIPFSDPVADGPVIQKAMARALQKRTTLEKVLEIICEIRAESEVAILVFTYFNPIQKDLSFFVRKVKEAGADGILIVDLPLEESFRYRKLCDEFDLAPIFVIAPSTPPERIEAIAKKGKGFLYYACRKGTTGVRSGLPEDLEIKVAQIRAKSTLPIAVGFGISDRKTADAVLEIADGFVVGSHFVEGNRTL